MEEIILRSNTEISSNTKNVKGLTYSVQNNLCWKEFLKDVNNFIERDIEIDSNFLDTILSLPNLVFYITKIIFLIKYFRLTSSLKN